MTGTTLLLLPTKVFATSSCVKSNGTLYNIISISPYPPIKVPPPLVATLRIIPETINDNPKSIVPAHTQAKAPIDSLFILAGIIFMVGTLIYTKKKNRAPTGALLKKVNQLQLHFQVLALVLFLTYCQAQPNTVNVLLKEYYFSILLMDLVHFDILYIIDRFEGDFAVCENYNIDEDSVIKIENIKKELIPEDAKEGDIIVVNNDNQIYIDYCANICFI